jgi:hypothetical protein
MTDYELTAQLAELVMGWKRAPDRFIKHGRSWIPRWRFRPLEELADAFQLLDHAADHFRLTCDRSRVFTAEVQIGHHRGKASGNQVARTITIAVARALGLTVTDDTCAPKAGGGRPKC